MNQKQHKRSAFSGKIGFVLSAAGASVGLGNIWRFPYLAAKYGGGIFLLIYIILAFTFGYTMIVAETALGRMTRKSPVGAFAASARAGAPSAAGSMPSSPSSSCLITRSSAAGSSGIWPTTSAATAVSWPQTATSPPSFPAALRRRSALSSLPSSPLPSSLQACATAWSGCPR